MFYQKFLLPYFMQFIGAALTVCGIVALGISHIDAMMFVAYILLSVGLLLIALSKEKAEDEYITYLRMRSIITVAIVCMIYSVISPFCDYLLNHYLDFTRYLMVRNIQVLITTTPLITLLYLVLFKGSILLNSKRDEQYYQN